MDHDDWLTERFETNRPRLRALAHRMLGSRDEADDVVQESWVRLARADSAVDNLDAWLTTVVARLCLDRLKSRRARLEVATDEPRVESDVDDEHDPASHALMAESVGAALLVVLELLPPMERVAFVLHDVFAVPFGEIGEILDRSPDATRQLASRARRRIHDSAQTREVDPVRHREVVGAFLAAAQGGDFEALVSLLDPEVTVRPDFGATRMGAVREMRGVEAVAGMLRGGARAAALALIDGMAGLTWSPAGTFRGVAIFGLRDGRIHDIEFIGDRDRLAELDIVTLDT